jgi:hypothetical protein
MKALGWALTRGLFDLVDWIDLALYRTRRRLQA